jgi:hypothetical protein
MRAEHVEREADDRRVVLEGRLGVGEFACFDNDLPLHDIGSAGRSGAAGSSSSPDPMVDGNPTSWRRRSATSSTVKLRIAPVSQGVIEATLHSRTY